MKYRVTEILAERTLGVAGTYVIDLDIQDPISKLLFEYKNTRGGVVNKGFLPDCLSKIELVDGADVLFSLTGKQMVALDFYDTAKVPYGFRTNAIGVQEMQTLNYNFGRKLWDPLLALDTKRFRNPQLKVTYDPAAADVAATVHTLKVLGFVFDEKAITPLGFLMSKEIKSYTAGAADSFDYTDLPLDHPIRKLLIEAYYATANPSQVVGEVRLSENNDRKVPIEERVSTLMKWVNSDYPEYHEEIYAVLTAVISSHYITPSWGIQVSGGGDGVAGYIGNTAGALHSPVGLYGNGNLNYRLVAHGQLPFSVVPIPFGDQQDSDDWYDVTALGNLKARLKTGSTAGGAVKLFAQQFRRY